METKTVTYRLPLDVYEKLLAIKEHMKEPTYNDAAIQMIEREYKVVLAQRVAEERTRESLVP